MNVDSYSLFVYLGALLLSLLVCHVYQIKKPSNAIVRILFLILISLPLSFVAGNRGGAVGTDYHDYIEVYEWATDADWSSLPIVAPSQELGCKILYKIIGIVSDKNVFAYGFTFEFLTILIALLGFDRFREKINLPFVFVLYYLALYHPSLNILRQGLATSFFIFSLYYLLNKKYVKYIITLFIGTFFHSSAIFFTVFIFAPYFTGRFKNGIRIKGSGKTVLFVILSFFFIMSINTVIHPLLSLLNYKVDYLKLSSDFGLGAFFYFAVSIVPILLYSQKEIKNKESLSLLQIICITYLPLRTLSYWAIWAGRLTLYIQVAWILLPALLTYNKNNNFIKLYTLGIFIFDYIYTYLYLNFHETFPYVTLS